MRYLRLKTKESFVVNGKLLHITFAYFGKEYVDPELLKPILSQMKPFTLHALREDKFGKNKDIDVVVYSSNEEVTTIRANMFQKIGNKKITSDNFLNWKPHISDCKMADIQSHGLNEINVIGIESNDDGKTFSLLFDSMSSSDTSDDSGSSLWKRVIISVIFGVVIVLTKAMHKPQV